MSGSCSRSALLGLLMAGLALDVSARQAEIAAPGTTWGELRTPASPQPEDSSNSILEGAIEQGIELKPSHGRFSFILFGRLDYSVDTKELEYNNKLKPAAGIKLRFSLPREAIADIGIKYQYDYRFTSNRKLRGTMLFVDWFKSWRISPAKPAATNRSFPLSYPGMTWGELRYPGSHDPSEDHDLILEGALEQGIDWVKMGDTIFNTFVSANYIVDSEKLDWNNELTLSAGMKLKFLPIKRGVAQLGIKYTHEHRWESGRSEQDVIGFLNWSAAWRPGI